MYPTVECAQGLWVAAELLSAAVRSRQSELRGVSGFEACQAAVRRYGVLALDPGSPLAASGFPTYGCLPVAVDGPRPQLSVRYPSDRHGGTSIVQFHALSVSGNRPKVPAELV